MDKVEKPKDKKRKVVKVATRMPTNQPSMVVVAKDLKPKAPKKKDPREGLEVIYDKETDGGKGAEPPKEKKPRKPRVKKERTDEQKEADKKRMAALRAMKKGGKKTE